MPKVWEKSVKVYLRLWKRQQREFCDGCGMVIKDDHFYKWTVSYIASADDWVNLDANSHTASACSGLALIYLLQQSPTEDQLLARNLFS